MANKFLLVVVSVISSCINMPGPFETSFAAGFRARPVEVFSDKRFVLIYQTVHSTDVETHILTCRCGHVNFL